MPTPVVQPISKLYRDGLFLYYIVERVTKTAVDPDAMSSQPMTVSTTSPLSLGRILDL
jgi:hypothetical protein